VQQSSYKSCFIKAFDAATNGGAVSLVARVTLLFTFFLIQLSYFGFLMSDAQGANLRPHSLLYAVSDRQERLVRSDFMHSNILFNIYRG